MHFQIFISSQKDKKLIYKIVPKDEEASETLKSENPLCFEYEDDVSHVPSSLAILPAIGLFLPVILTFDGVLEVESIDESFINAINKIREGFKATHKDFSFGGKIIYSSLVKNSYPTSKDALLFSNGVDAMATLLNHHQEISDCITIWGSDIPFDEEVGWSHFYKETKRNCILLKKRSLIIKTNFRKILNVSYLNKRIRDKKAEWWHDFEHGPVLILSVVPYSYLHGYSNLYIAASFTPKFDLLCASHPKIDEAFTYGETKTIHDGFSFTRVDKLRFIKEFTEKENLVLPLHVCWVTTAGENCLSCEKCIRTYLSALAASIPLENIGMKKIPTIRIKKIFGTSVVTKNLEAHIDSIQSAIQKDKSLLKEPALRWIASINLKKREGKYLSPFWSFPLRIKRFVKRVILNFPIRKRNSK